MTTLQQLLAHLNGFGGMPDLRNANLQYANLQYANLRNADLRGANLQYADLQYADLRNANLQYADLRNANLRNANLRNADLQYANLQYANLRYATLRYANLRNANLQYADLRNANLQYADLRGANLRNANLSQSAGFQTAEDFINQLETTTVGVIAYKCFGSTTYVQPWRVNIGEVLIETVNCQRTEECGCGVNVATKSWMLNNPLNYKGRWMKVLIPWTALADVVVPFNTDGKFRCGRCVIMGDAT